MRPLRTILTIVLMTVALGCASTEKDSVKNNAPLQSLTLMRQGSVLFQQEQYQAALQRFREAQALTPDNGTIFNMIGLCHFRLDDLAQAMDSFNAALEVIPGFTDARNNRGSVYLAMKQFQLAEVDFIAVLGDSTYPHHWEAYYNLGLANLGLVKLGAAEENFARAVRAPTPVFEAALRLAEIKQQKGEIDRAIELLENANLRFSDRFEAKLALGRLLTTLGRNDEAQPYLEGIVHSYPGSAMAEEASRLLGNN